MDSYFLTQPHRRLRETVRAFVEDEVRPLIPQLESSRRADLGLSWRIAA